MGSSLRLGFMISRFGISFFLWYGGSEQTDHPITADYRDYRDYHGHPQLRGVTSTPSKKEYARLFNICSLYRFGNLSGDSSVHGSSVQIPNSHFDLLSQLPLHQKGAAHTNSPFIGTTSIPAYSWCQSRKGREWSAPSAGGGRRQRAIMPIPGPGIEPAPTCSFAATNGDDHNLLSMEIGWEFRR